MKEAPFFVLSLLLVPAALGAPVISTLNPTAGATISALNSVQVTFSEPVTGVDATDFLINAEAAVAVSGIGTGPYTFTFTQPPPGAVSLSWEFDHGIAGTGGTGAFVPDAGWTYTLTDIEEPAIAKIRTSMAGQEMDAVVPAGGATVSVLTQAEVTFSENVTGVAAAHLEVNGSPATTVTGAGAGPYVFTFTSPPDGSVTFAVTTSAPGIFDGAGNRFSSGASWTVTKSPAVPGIIITEFLAANASGLTDENAETSDWIELTNTGMTAVNLVGWSLTNDIDRPDMWIFPSRTINAGGRLMVFASGKDRKSAFTSPHTNFALSAEGGYLALFSPDSPRLPVSVFEAYPPQRYNISYGLLSDGSLRYFSPPSPNAANAATGLIEVTPRPTVSVSRGFFNEAFPLILSCVDPAAVIRYTLDGSVPIATSPPYTAPLAVSNTTVLRAVAFSPDKVSSETITHSYLFLDQALAQASPPYNNPARTDDETNPPLPTVSNAPGGVAFPIHWGTNTNPIYAFPGRITNLATGQIPADYGMDPEIVDDSAKYGDNGAVDAVAGRTNLERIRQSMREWPLLSIVLKNDDVFGSAGIYTEPNVRSKGAGFEKPCSVELLLPDGTTGFATTCGLRIHGNASREPWKNPKHGFKLNFKGTFGAATLDYRLFPDSPVHEIDDLILRADFNSSWTHWDGPTQRPKGTRMRDAFCKDTFRDMGRVAGHHRYVHLFINGLYWGTYDPTEQENNGFAATYFGGKKDDYDVVEQGALKSGTLTAYSAMLAISSPIDNAKYEQMKQALDVPWFIDYMLLHFYLGHQDWGDDVNKNWYAVRNKNGGQFRYLPWDMENLMWAQTVDRTTVASPPSGLHPKLVTNNQYKLDLADLAHRHLVAVDGALQPAANTARWNEWRAVLQNGIVCESARWGDYRRDVHQYQTAPYPLFKWNVDWMTEQNRLVNTYFPTRTNIVLGQLRARGLYPALNAPEFSNNADNALMASQRVGPGFELKMTLPTPPPAGTTSAGTIYYTTDGSDPRVYYDTTGQRTPAAQTYSAPFAINATTTVKARALNGTVWSALNEATFTIGSISPAVRITEIHYNPRNSQGGSSAEFIELQNTGATEVDLGGWYFEGVDFIIPAGLTIGPGDRRVFASNNAPATFAAQYPGVTVSAYFGGALNNGGERLTLRDDSDRAVFSVEYDDLLPWATAADGVGPSLEIVDPDGDPQSPFNWKASALAKGTPGAANSSAAPAAIIISEFLANNRDPLGMEMEFVELHNPGVAPMDIGNWKFRLDGVDFTIPSGTSVAAGGYLTIDAVSAASILPPLNDLRGEIVLLSATGARVDGVRYGPQAAGYSFSRINGIWTLSSQTRGAANGAAASAPVASLRFNEWLANPLPGDDDWIELFNTHASLPVVLTGLLVGAGNEITRVSPPAAIAPTGWLQLFCVAESQRADTLLFNLPAAGTTLVLQNVTGDVIDSASFAAQTENVSQGRMPDGTGSITSLAYPSPGIRNHGPLADAPRFNEVLIINRDGDNAPWARRPPWIEIHNPHGIPIDLAAWQLVDQNLRRWWFPAGINVPPGGYRAIWCDPMQLPSTSAQSHLNSALSLDDGLFHSIILMNPASQIADRISWGRQISDKSIGRLNDGTWALLAIPTRGSANVGPAMLGTPPSLRLNEWVGVPVPGGVDEFVEIFNTGAGPVDMGALWLGDEPSEVGRRKWQIPALTFLEPQAHALFEPDSGAGSSGYSFGIDAGGEYLRLSHNDAAVTALDSVNFGQLGAGAAQGRLPDGSATIADLAPTPGSANSTTPGPVFIRRPRSIAAPAGQIVQLSVMVQGVASFQWLRNQVIIDGQTSAFLTLGPLTAADDAVYTCAATNAAGSTLSLPARVTVLYTYAAWAAEKGVGAANQDPDNDGLTNGAEFLAGTNPLSQATAAERAAVHAIGGGRFAGGASFLSMDLRLNRRAAYSGLNGELSPNLLSPWTSVSPSSIEVLATEANGDQRVRFEFAVPPPALRQFLRMRLEP
ncbi:MAG: lamin tail domain-containing protein [Verrucomicrobiales bacterium]